MITLAQAKLAAAVAAIILLTTGVGTLVVYTALSPGRAPVATTNPAVTQPPMVPPPTTPRVLPAPSDAEVRAIVTKTLPEVRFDAVAFSDVMDFLRDITGASIFVNWRALEAARINKNTPITVRLRNVRFSTSLAIILDDAGADNARFAWTVGDGIITISTADEINAWSGTSRVYDVRDVTGPPAAIIDLIRNGVPTGQWGRADSIESHDGYLVIKTASECHERIGALLAQLRGGPEGAKAAADEAAASKVKFGAPSHVLPEVRFDAVALADVIDFLRDITGANIHVFWKPLEAAGISRRTPITLRLRDTTFEKALSLILSDASTDKTKAAWTASDGVIRISTADQVNPTTIWRLYDVRDLTASSASTTKLAVSAQLMDLIRQSIPAGNWGQTGSIVEYNGQLAVTTTTQTHQEIRSLLDQLHGDPAVAADRTISAALARVLPEVRFDAVGLADAIDFLRDITGANIYVPWTTLQAAGTGRQDPVTERLRDVSLATALSSIVSHAGNEQNKLAYTTDENVIVISTADDVNQRTCLRIYDLGPRLSRLPESARPAATADLIARITRTCDPATWDKTASIRQFNGRLVVRATSDAQRQIQTLLNAPE